MGKKITTIVCLLVLVSLVGWGCQSATEKVAEKATEKAIEDSGGGNVDVDIDDQTVEITDQNTNISASYGKNELPEDWPSDAPTYEGDIIATTTQNDTFFQTSWQTDKSADDVYDYYQEELVDQGWTVDSTMSVNQFKSLSATKGNWTLALTVTPDEEEDVTTYSVTVSQEEE